MTRVLLPVAWKTASKEAPARYVCFEVLVAPLRVWARGLFSAEAAVELLIGHRLWLYRDDFREIGVEFGWETFSGRVMGVGRPRGGGRRAGCGCPAVLGL